MDKYPHVRNVVLTLFNDGNKGNDRSKGNCIYHACLFFYFGFHGIASQLGIGNSLAGNYYIDRTGKEITIFVSFSNHLFDQSLLLSHFRLDMIWGLLGYFLFLAWRRASTSIYLSIWQGLKCGLGSVRRVGCFCLFAKTAFVVGN